jgi:hypothetical protein
MCFSQNCAEVTGSFIEASVRFIADAAYAKGELAIASVELERKSAQLEALNKLVAYLKLHSNLFSVAAPAISLAAVAPSPQQSHSTTVDALREALSSRSVEVAFWRESHQQMAAALVLAEEELQTQTTARSKCEEQMRCMSSARIIDAKNSELQSVSQTHSEYVQSTTRVLEQQEVALAELQRHTIQFPGMQHSSTQSSRVVFDQDNSLSVSNHVDVQLVHKLQAQVQELEEQLLLQPRAARTNLNPSYKPSMSASPDSRTSLSDYVPPPLPPSDLLDEVGFSSTSAGTMISLASSDPTSLVASVSTSLDELGRFVSILCHCGLKF